MKALHPPWQRNLSFPLLGRRCGEALRHLSMCDFLQMWHAFYQFFKLMTTVDLVFMRLYRLLWRAWNWVDTKTFYRLMFARLFWAILREGAQLRLPIREKADLWRAFRWFIRSAGKPDHGAASERWWEIVELHRTRHRARRQMLAKWEESHRDGL